MRLLIIDGNHLASRARHAHAGLSTSDGQQSGVIYGFLQSLSFARNKLRLELANVWVCWDYGRADWRLKLYPDYKKRAVKEMTPEEQKDSDEEKANYLAQLRALEEVLALVGVRQIRVGGCEADDLIAITTRLLHGDGHDVTILSGDRDLHQLCDVATIFDPQKELMDKEAVLAFHQVDVPEQILILKSVRGDPSDNIAGVPGLGEVRSLEALPGLTRMLCYGAAGSAMNEAATNKSLAKALANLDIIERNMELMRLPATWADAPYYTDEQLESYLAQYGTVPEPDELAFVKFLKHWEFDSIIEHLERW